MPTLCQWINQIPALMELTIQHGEGRQQTMHIIHNSLMQDAGRLFTVREKKQLE